jgi:hypothetical protein
LVRASVKNAVLHLEPVGWDQLLALSRGLNIPLACIKSATAAPPGLPKFRWTDLRLGGTGVPGTLAAGRFWMGSPHRWVFLDLRRSSKEVLVLELQDYGYDAAMVEVDDVARVLKMIKKPRERDERIDLESIYAKIWKDAAPAQVVDVAVFCDSDDTHTGSISYGSATGFGLPAERPILTFSRGNHSRVRGGQDGR